MNQIHLSVLTRISKLLKIFVTFSVMNNSCQTLILLFYSVIFFKMSFIYATLKIAYLYISQFSFRILGKKTRNRHCFLVFLLLRPPTRHSRKQTITIMQGVLSLVRIHIYSFPQLLYKSFSYQVIFRLSIIHNSSYNKVFPFGKKINRFPGFLIAVSIRNGLAIYYEL